MHPSTISRMLSLDNRHLLPQHHSGRTKKISWVCSNMRPQNRRGQIAEELSKFIQVRNWRCIFMISMYTLIVTTSVLRATYAGKHLAIVDHHNEVEVKLKNLKTCPRSSFCASASKNPPLAIQGDCEIGCRPSWGLHEAGNAWKEWNSVDAAWPYMANLTYL